MANYFAIASRFPAVRDYLRNRRWVRRGDVIAYAPDMRTRCFSTDALGFRHSIHRGRAHGIASAETERRYGVVLGSSHIFGFGLEGDAETLPSQLSERVGFPCLNISYPEADSRTLYSTLLRIVTESANRPSLIVFFNGGDLTRYSFSGAADPVFGPPNFDSIERLGDSRPAEEAEFRKLAFFCRLWTTQCVELARRFGIPFCFAMDSTFFEKAEGDQIEQDCQLGVATSEANGRRFALHRHRVFDFARIRVAAANELGIPAPFFYAPAEMHFIDEFHFRAESLGFIAARIAGRMAARL